MPKEKARHIDFERLIKKPQVFIWLIMFLGSLFLILLKGGGFKLGLDIAGGIQVIMAPDGFAAPEDMALSKQVLSARFNKYGLANIPISVAGDLLTKQSFIVINFPNAKREDVEKMIKTTGKFEAKIKNITIFNRTKRVYTDAKNSGTRRVAQDRYEFYFTVDVDPEGAKRFKEVTDTCELSPDGEHLEKDCMLELYVDGENISNLTISAELKGRAVERPSITGGGKTREEALKEMRHLQTILSTGALPVKLKIVAMNEISPKLGKDFLNKALIAGIAALFGVIIITFIKYRNWRIVIPIVVTSASEVIIILGIANIIGWTIDLSALAGLIAAVGTGVDSQIIISDEMLRGEHRRSKIFGWRARLKRAFFIIFAAASTTISAMIPLAFVGLGAVKGFAIMTTLGVLASVLISRPAFIKLMEEIV